MNGNRSSVELSAAAFWRASLGDGVYDVPGQQIRPTGASRARFVGSQLELGISWQAARTFALSGSLGRFGAGRFLQETGRGDPVYMSGVEATYKF